MIFTHGKTEKLGSTDWYMLELSSEGGCQNILRRLFKAIPGIMRKEAFQLFLPVSRRDLNIFELSTANYLFVRSTSFSALARLKQITGIVGLVTKGGSNYPIHALPMSNEYVQNLIEALRLQTELAASQIKPGAFVRILDGLMRDFCGVVTELNKAQATVLIEMNSKHMLVRTPRRNLVDLSHVTPEKRTYYFSEELC